MDDATRNKLEVLVTRRQLHSQREKDEKAAVDALTAEIKDLLPSERIELDRWQVTLSVQKGRSSIRADKLLARGVDPDIIADATEVGSPITTLRVTEKKAPGA